MSRENYPSSDIYEKYFIVKIFHNKELQKKYLDGILPSVFLDVKRRVIIYIMKSLHKENIDINVENILLYQLRDSKDFKSFLKKHKASKLTEEEVCNMVYNMEVSSSDEYFALVKEELLIRAFSRYVSDLLDSIKYYQTFYTQESDNIIVSKMKAAIKLHKIIRGHTYNHTDHFEDVKKLINEDNEYYPTCSNALNNYIGGFTRGFPAVIAAKSSHCKSSWADYNILHNILSGKVNKVLKITPEESAAIQLRRYISMICKISITDMRNKKVTITDEHINIVKSKIQNKIEIIDNVSKLKDIAHIMENSDADMIYIDHINAIDYPGTGTFLERMIGNIPELINIEKKICSSKHISIVNLSQVNDKNIQRSSRMIKAPRFWDVYASSALYHASREFITLWYPYRDQEDDDLINTNYDPTDVRLFIEKSSFSTVGRIRLKYMPEYNLFIDIKSQLNKSEEKKHYNNNVQIQENLF